MAAGGFGLGIDFGTSSTVALLRWPDGRVKPLLFDGSPLLPSAVFAPADGALVVGRDALHHARFAPAGLEPNPKRCIDAATVLLGEREVAVADLVTAVLRHVAEEARRVTGGTVAAVALSHPAGWGPVRRLVLADAAAAAGLGRVTLVPEPVAAARYFTTVLGREIAVGQALVVYDFGAGTFDVSIVQRTEGGFEVRAVDGLDDVGGVDVDAAIVAWLRDRHAAGNPEAWQRLAHPTGGDDARQRSLLWDDARAAKEILSRAPAVLLRPPLLDAEVPLTREEFEAIAGPLVDRTVRTTTDLVRYAQLGTAQISGLFLVGGSSRIPLAATALHRALEVAPILTDQPEVVVAEGTLHSIPGAEQPARGAPAYPTSGPPAYPVSAPPVSAPPANPTSGPPARPVSDPPTRVMPVIGPPAGPSPGPAGRRPVRPAPPPVPRSAPGRPAPVWAPAAPVYMQPMPPPRPVYLLAARPVAPRKGGCLRPFLIFMFIVALIGSLVYGCATGVIPVPESLSNVVMPETTASAIPSHHRAIVDDPLTAKAGWQPRDDAANRVTCRFQGALVVTKTGGGTYRCPGPTAKIRDFEVFVDVTLNVAGSCAGLWFRFTNAGYALRVCEDGYHLVLHGRPEANSVTEVYVIRQPLKVGTRSRVGLKVDGASLTFYSGNRQIGRTTDTTFVGAGIVAIGIFSPTQTPQEKGEVAFSNIQIWAPG